MLYDHQNDNIINSRIEESNGMRHINKYDRAGMPTANNRFNYIDQNHWLDLINWIKWWKNQLQVITEILYMRYDDKLSIN